MFRPAAFVRVNSEILGCVCSICRKIVVLPIITLLLVSDKLLPTSEYLIGFFFWGGGWGTGALVCRFAHKLMLGKAKSFKLRVKLLGYFGLW